MFHALLSIQSCLRTLLWFSKFSTRSIYHGINIKVSCQQQQNKLKPFLNPRAHTAICHCSHLLLKCRVEYCFYYSFTLYYCAIFYSLDTGFFQYHQGVKQFGSRSGPTFCLAWYGSKLFAKDISRHSGSRFNTKQLVDTFCPKPSLKLISFGSNFFPFS